MAPLATVFRRMRITLRLTALTSILVGPIALAAWDLRQAERVDGLPAPADEQLYLARRNPVIDQLLSNGEGGTRFVEHLNGNAGMAFTRPATIALAALVTSAPWPESVELHERAHLVDAFLPEAVARLMARMSPPAAGEYAARNRGEHFAEMAGTAWELVVAPEGMCVEATPAAALQAADARVPGTAGFVVWYLRNAALADTDTAATLRPLAEELIAPQRAQWEALWRALDARRLSDGTFERWPGQTVREYIEEHRASARASGLWIDRVVDLALAPSLMLLAIAGE